MKYRKRTKLAEWQEKVKTGEFKCACGKGENITVDHIIPRYFLESLYQDLPKNRWTMLYEDEENFQVMCSYCNSKKAHRLDIRNPKTMPLIKRFLKEIEDYLTQQNLPAKIEE